MAVIGAAVVAAVAAPVAWAETPSAGGVGSSRATSGPASRPDFVTPTCRMPANARACRVALRYLAALDLDRTREACRLLAPETLENAGGLAGCETTLRQARGIRIRYSIHGVHRSPVGTTVQFSTQGRSNAPVPQVMFVSPAGKIVLVAPAPWAAG
jgi:hypothetical protein